MKIKIPTIIILLFIFSSVFSQEYNYPLGNNFDRLISKNINNSNAIIHTSFKPLRISYVEKQINKTNLLIDTNRLKIVQKIPLTSVWKKIFIEDLIKVEQKNLTFYANPIVNYHKTKLNEVDYEYGQNTRGFEIHGSLGSKLSFYSDFFENQTFYLPYVQQKVNNSLVAPGQAVWKPFGDDKQGKDYNYATGYLSFTPIDFLNIQFGHSKHFIGSGYRSMLLSDNSVAYPFLKFTFTKNKIQYTAMFTEFQNFKTKFYFYHYKKHGSFLFINYFPIKNLQIGFFEGTIWKTTNEITFERKVPLLYFLPVPGIREAVYGLNNQNNVLIGLNASYNLFKYAELYSQFALDDIKSKKFAYQTGFRIFDVFNDNIKKQNLYIQTEYNYAKPYTYSHEYAYSAFTNFNEPLINTLSAGFTETLAIINWQFYGFEIELKYNNILTSTDTANSNFGTNLMLSNSTATFPASSSEIGQGNKTIIINYNLSFAYIINTSTNLKIFAEVNKRNFSSDISNNEIFFVSFGIKNTLKNIYTDY